VKLYCHKDFQSVLTTHCVHIMTFADASASLRCGRTDGLTDGRPSDDRRRCVARLFHSSTAALVILEDTHPPTQRRFCPRLNVTNTQQRIDIHEQMVAKTGPRKIDEHPSEEFALAEEFVSSPEQVSGDLTTSLVSVHETVHESRPTNNTALKNNARFKRNLCWFAILASDRPSRLESLLSVRTADYEL